MADTSTLVKTVIEVLNDGARGYADFAEHIKSPEVKTFFISEGQTRGQFAREVAAAAGIPDDVGGTAAGSVHRIWGDLKASLGGSDSSLLDTAELGEDAVKKAYDAAIHDSSVDPAVRSVLTRQQPHIQAAHDKVKALRNSLAS